MDLVAVIAQLKAYAPLFGGRVAGAAEFDARMAAEVRPEVYPAAYVVPLTEDADPNDEDNALYQTVTERVGVVVEFDNSADRRGQSVTELYAPARAAIFAAILNWRGTDPDHAQRGFEYGGGQVLSWDRARLFYQFEFTLLTLITDEDGWQVDNPDLVEIDANSDPDEPQPPFKYVPPAA